MWTTLTRYPRINNEIHSLHRILHSLNDKHPRLVSQQLKFLGKVHPNAEVENKPALKKQRRQRRSVQRKLPGPALSAMSEKFWVTSTVPMSSRNCPCCQRWTQNCDPFPTRAFSAFYLISAWEVMNTWLSTLAMVVPRNCIRPLRRFLQLGMSGALAVLVMGTLVMWRVREFSKRRKDAACWPDHLHKENVKNVLFLLFIRWKLQRKLDPNVS